MTQFSIPYSDSSWFSLQAHFEDRRYNVKGQQKIHKK